LDLVSLGALVALILGITNRLATAIMVLPWFKPRQLNAQLAQLIIRAMGVAGALIAVFEGGRYLGVPLTTLVAGVSVSGLTVALAAQDTDRKSTRLNSSHDQISYAVFCLKKKNKT